VVFVPQAAFRRISNDVFGHLLELDLTFHVHRKTGQIMRILDRGTSSIQVCLCLCFDMHAPPAADPDPTLNTFMVHAFVWWHRLGHNMLSVVGLTRFELNAVAVTARCAMLCRAVLCTAGHCVYYPVQCYASVD
jgi:ABC-type transport system involved in Fe-S cluster assembly fused permease/ATPase subunit